MTQMKPPSMSQKRGTVAGALQLMPERGEAEIADRERADIIAEFGRKLKKS